MMEAMASNKIWSAAADVPVRVVRSERRRRTVSAAWKDGTAVVSIPASFSDAEELHWVTTMVRRLQVKARRAGTGTRTGSDELRQRALALSQRYLQGRAVPAGIKWVSNQNSRWGSATPAHGTIRLSDKLQGMPDWVVDYVILHELSHLLVPGHGPDFWAQLKSYPDTERARAFLAGVAYAGARGLRGDFGEDPDDDVVDGHGDDERQDGAEAG
jgi:predicted metal-dependent hydrolase